MTSRRARACRNLNQRPTTTITTIRLHLAAVLCQLFASGRQLDIVEIMYWARCAAGTALSAFRRQRRVPGKVERLSHPAGGQRALCRPNNCAWQEQWRWAANVAAAKWKRHGNNDVSPIYDPPAAKLTGQRALTTRLRNAVYHGRNTITIIQ